MQPFAAVGKRVSRRSAKYPFGERTRSGPSGTPAPTSARRGGSERNALGGAELPSPEAWQKEERAVGDAGPYEIQKRGRGGPTAGGVEPRPYADVQNFIVSAARRAAPTLAVAGGRCAI